ncbi:MAG: TerB family tellurite resistance protein [Ideonella sp.]|nr:TerB family tellurite resistance protein [Ideonella sp.]MCC7458495.1 TerB family tellurite resistance protein [Nitrospira sp.]
MLQTLKDLFDHLLLPASPGASAAADERALRLAVAVMLVEVMRADPVLSPSERQAVHDALRVQFALGEDDAAQLADLAETTAQHSTDLFTYTSRIDERFDMAQKIHMIELMWRVAYADGKLSEYERHVMWRIADLLHVPQGAYVNARLRARDAAAG